MSSLPIIECKILSNDLFKATSTLGSLVSNNPVMPILSNFLFEIKPDTLTITGSDHHNWVVTKVKVTASAAASIAVPATILVETLRSLPPQPLLLKIDLQNYTMVVETSNGHYRMACENHIDFPTIPSIGDQKEVVCNVAPLKKAFKQSVFAASKDDMHPNICGVNVGLYPDTMVLAATDGHRLVRYRLKHDFEAALPPITLPVKSIQLLLNLLSVDDEAGQVRLVIDAQHVHFLTPKLHIIVLLVDGNYPDIDVVIPKDHPYEASVVTKDLRKAVKTIEYYASKSTHEMHLTLDKGVLKVEAEDREFSNHGEIKISCRYDGKPMKIGLNARLFFEMLKNVASEAVKIRCSDAYKPLLVLPERSDSKDDVLMLIMPLAFRKD